MQQGDLEGQRVIGQRAGWDGRVAVLKCNTLPGLSAHGNLATLIARGLA